MRIPLSWLSEFIQIPASNSEISHTLTNLGLEVDAVEDVSPSFSGVVVGKVLEAKKHPDAEKLTVAQVTDGTETVQVVCAASNCRPGINVAFAKIGASLQNPDGSTTKIKKSKLRGVESSGMLCAADELGFGGEHEGIMELGDSLPLGTDLSKQYSDTVFEISLTPNLGHCFSVLGVARELAAGYGKQVTMPKVRIPQSAPNKLKVSIKDFDRCPRYASRFISGVKVAPSPEWLQKKLIAAGMRPINNVVDITNYVLLELGHPLHAFDASKIEGNEIIARSATAGESFTTLDGKERVLTHEDLVIADPKKILAIGGVMGGQDSEVTGTTTDIVLESAYFAPFTIRRSSRRLGIQTEASKRFERGADPNMVPLALDRAAEMIRDIAGGTIADVIDVKRSEFAPLKITCRLKRVNEILGVTLSLSEVESALNRLHMKTEATDINTLQVTVPTYRSDVTHEIDLIEEVARIYGYNNLKKEIDTYRSSEQPHSPLFLFERELRHRLCGEGLQEFLSCDLISPKLQQLIQNSDADKNRAVTVLNPVSEEQSVLRTSLMPGLLELVRYNQDHQMHDISGFEIGRVYFRGTEGYREQLVAGLVMAGKQRPNSWDQKPNQVDFFDLKGIVENVIEYLGISNTVFKKSSFNSLHPGRQASLYVGEMEIATIGEVHPSILRDLGINQPVLFAEMSLQDLMQKRKANVKMQPLAKYPGSERDWTITLTEATPIDAVFQAIHAIPSRLLETVTLKDIFRHETKVGKGMKNATFHFIYRDLKKTLSQEAVETEHARIIDESNKTLKR